MTNNFYNKKLDDFEISTSKFKKSEDLADINIEEVKLGLENEDINSLHWINQGKYFIEHLEKDMIENSPTILKQKKWEKELKEMWDKSRGYILVKDHTDDIVPYSIDMICSTTGQIQFCLIEDDELYQFIVKKMLENNMPIYEYSNVNGQIRLIRKK